MTGETTLRGPQSEDYIPPESCARCKTAIEEDCVRLGMFNRWHSACVLCVVCGDKAVLLVKDRSNENSPKEDGTVVTSRPSRKSPPRVDEFFFEPSKASGPPTAILCVSHRSPTCQHGFATVSRLEQYAFLLHIALRRLYVHFRMHHELPSGMCSVVDSILAHEMQCETGH